MGSEYFTTKELSCRCGCGFKITEPTFLARLDNLRKRVGEPLILSSAARCQKHNTEIGGARNSAHVLGLAVDIVCVDSHLRFKLVKAALEVGFRRMEWGTKTWLHVDDGTEATGHPRDRIFLP